MDIIVHNHYQFDDTKIIHLLTQILNNQTKIMNELETLTTEVSETNTVIDSAITLIKGIKAALDAAGTDKVKLKELSDSLDSKTNELAAAVSENTPSAEEPTE